MKRFTLMVLLLCAVVMAADLEEGGWVLSTGTYGSGPDDITATLISNNGITLKIDSSSAGKAFFKIVSVFEKPTNESYDLEFDVKINALNIDLDYGQNFGAGEKTTNDGPNLFSFAYDWNESKLDDLPVNLRSLSFYDRKDSLCHFHMECNWMGDPEAYYGFYCSSEIPAAGWVYDAWGYGKAVKVNDVNAEAFQDNDWKTIRMNMDKNECGTNTTTIMIMGVDTLGDKPYTWEIKNIKLVADEVISLPLNYVYKYDNGEYTRVDKPAYCGDGEQDGVEECDGNTGLETGWTCTSNCKLEEICGDNMLVGNELCDGMIKTPGFTCASNCSAETPLCGDGILVANEVCDNNNTKQGFTCANDCMSMSSVCGDGIVVSNEECDGTKGIDIEHACSWNCTLYRLLSVEEQEGIDKFVQLIESAETGMPSTAKMVVKPGTYTAKDFANHFLVNNKSIEGNITFCSVGITECEARYIFVEDAYVTQSTLAPEDQLTGIAKVYKTEINGTTSYFIGFKGGTGWMPYIEMDTTLWIVVGVLMFLLFLAGLFLLLLVGGFVYVSKKGGVSFKKIFK